jgi:hypothetical protein
MGIEQMMTSDDNGAGQLKKSLYISLVKNSMPLLRVICWAIIFLTRIRFPPGVSIAVIYNWMM